MLVVVLLIANAYSVGAVGVIGEMVTDISGMNQLSVSAAINDYFASREAFLLNQADTINVPLAGMIADEWLHTEKYESENIVFVDSMISIDEVTVFDTNAEAKVTESVTYLHDDITNIANVEHTLILAPNEFSLPTMERHLLI